MASGAAATALGSLVRRSPSIGRAITYRCQLRNIFKKSWLPGCQQHPASFSTTAEPRRGKHKSCKRLTMHIDDSPVTFDNIFLRDACACPLCVDPSTQQKLFQTTDIPVEIQPRSMKTSAEGDLEISWDNDILGYDSNHITHLPARFLEIYADKQKIVRSRFNDQRQVTWNRNIMEADVKWIEYEEYMKDDLTFFKALKQLSHYGLVFLRGLPDSEQSVERVGNRIGALRDTFYGRTWDVKSVPNAKNVAYTPLNLGLHMDLLYFANPPGLQLLHCLRNSVTGGSSIFADSFQAARLVQAGRPDSFPLLTRFPVTYHYRNAGEHYHFTRPVIELEEFSYHKSPRIANVNWSPPFQGPFEDTFDTAKLRLFLSLTKEFASHLSKPESQFELTLKPGECAIFNNRRTLHARRAFDPMSGERWLKGAYVDSDPFKSRLRVLSEQFGQLGSWAA